MPGDRRLDLCVQARAAGEGARQGQTTRRLQHRELLPAQGQLRPRPVVRGAGPRARQGRHDRRCDAQRRHLAPRERRVAPVRRRPVRQPRRGGRGRQGPRGGRGPEGRAHAHQRHQWRRHRGQVRHAVRCALVSRQLPHATCMAPCARKDGSYYFALNLAHDGSGSAYTGGGNVMGTWGGFNGWAIRVEPDGKYELFANGLRSPASLGVEPGRPRLVHRQPGRFRRHVQDVRAPEGQRSTAIPPASSICRA